ncbi:hypothetical protein GCM10011390_41670 [Aureimonas endophytica]|uniref:Uncharacterized protein n=1 Tax=Aureimonas endophytica TaxID=2027858 RepID=A0A917E9V6_9HYPH|nr:hypothetical protein [Aureimonas endophytica]GGE18146.1 hypothetical protein GCM10011390_41670 [Aureimonas endophytica]
MPQLYPVAGKKISISTTSFALPSTGDVAAADFSALTWTEIAGWETEGAHGDSRALITTQLIAYARDTKTGGTKNAGSMQNNFALVPGDAGQAALLAAASTNANYAFKIEGNDKPTAGASPKNSLEYFAGLVMGFSRQGGSANTVQMIQSTIEINTNVVFVPASAS